MAGGHKRLYRIIDFKGYNKLDIPATLNSGVFVLRNKDNTLNNVFLVYSLLSEDFKRFIKNIKIGDMYWHGRGLL